MTRIVGASYHSDFRRPSPFSIPSSSTSISSSPSSTITKTTTKNNDSSITDEDYWSTPGTREFQITPKVKQILEEQPWYHGKIKRIDAINLLKYNGDFLVRDSISNQGDYVLTGLCRNEPMHFEIHRAPSSDPKIDLYYFEDEQFRSVVDLIQFYLNHRRQVTSKSRFVLLNPVVNTEKLELPHNKFQMEIEATYAPFINKQAQFSARYDRSLSQKAIINQAKKRLNGSEHDLMHLLAASSSTSTSNLSNQLTPSKSFGHLHQSSVNDTHYKKNGTGIKVTSFGVDENNGYCTEKTFIPPKSSRPIPKFPPPKSPIAFPEDLDDYDDLDYEAMEEEQKRLSSSSSNSSTTSPPSTVPLIRSPPVIPPKPLSLLKAKRNSEFIDSSNSPEHCQHHHQQQQYIDPTRKHSAHSLFPPSNNNSRNSGELESPEDLPLPAYLDRTQSCQNLVYRQRTKSGKDISEMTEEETFRRYPSVKIDPAPLLPTRSKESLCSISALASSVAAASAENNDTNNDAMDYDDLKGEPDYDKVKAKESKPPIQNPSEPLQQQPPQQLQYQQHHHRPKTFAQLRAISQPPKQIRHLLNYFASLTIEKLSLLITSEDIKVFNLTHQKNNNNNHSPSNALKKLFMSESRALREEVLDRNACLQLTVSMTIQKAHNPKDILKAWILTAAHLLHKIGNGFSFGAIMAAITSEKLKHPRTFAELEASTTAHLKSLIPIYEDFIAGKMPPSIAGCFLPFIQPLLQLFSASDYVQANALKNINSNGLDNLEILSNMIHLARHVLFQNDNAKLEESIEASTISGPNPFSTESLIHCLLATPSLSTEPKESERRKIRQMFEQNSY